LDARSFRAYRLSRLAALAIVAAAGLWAVTIGLMLKDFNKLTAHFDPVVRFAQVFGVLAFSGGFVLLVVNLRTVWTGQRRWPAKVWSVVLAASALIVLWVALAFKLIGFGVNY
jgi:hypothetical protein